MDVGITDEGTEVQHEIRYEEIQPSDAFGDSLLDVIFRGGNCSLQFVSKAFKAGSVSPFAPWNTLGQLATAALPIGRLGSDVAAAFVMTATSGTPAVTTALGQVINTLTATSAILAPNSPGTLLFNTRLRKVPLRLLALPFLFSSSTYRWYATT